MLVPREQELSISSPLIPVGPGISMAVVQSQTQNPLLSYR